MFARVKAEGTAGVDHERMRPAHHAADAAQRGAVLRAAVGDAVRVEVARRVDSAWEEYREWERVLELKDAKGASACTREVTQNTLVFGGSEHFSMLSVETVFSLSWCCLILLRRVWILS